MKHILALVLLLLTGVVTHVDHIGHFDVIGKYVDDTDTTGHDTVYTVKFRDFSCDVDADTFDTVKSGDIFKVRYTEIVGLGIVCDEILGD